MIGLLSCALSVFSTRIATRSSFFRRREKAVVMVSSSPPFMWFYSGRAPSPPSFFWFGHSLSGLKYRSGPGVSEGFVGVRTGVLVSGMATSYAMVTVLMSKAQVTVTTPAGGAGMLCGAAVITPDGCATDGAPPQVSVIVDEPRPVPP